MILPKYEDGQRVWVATLDTVVRTSTCPDCLGTKHWPVTTPGGDSFDLECPTCRYGYEVRGELSRKVVVGIARQMTIGSVHTDTASVDHPVEYMMLETGVGAGRVWREANVFLSQKEAQARADADLAKRQAEYDERDAARVADQKKRTSKPDYKDRRIRELEKQVAEVSNAKL